MRPHRTGIVLLPDKSRVLSRPFELVNRERVLRIVARVSALSDAEARAEARAVLARFESRHPNLRAWLASRFEEVRPFLATDRPLAEEHRLLLAAHFTLEYSIEAAALFNPSIVPHPDQSGLPKGALRFVLSLRATGEGHISSIVFRSGIVSADGAIQVLPPSPLVRPPHVIQDPAYDKPLFSQKLQELGLLDPLAGAILASLPDTFTQPELAAALDRARRTNRALTADARATLHHMLALARANYEIQFESGDRISERVIFPHTPAESRGIEDARFVAFRNDDRSTSWYATYTAYDGQVILPQLLETRDFCRFRVSTLNGPAVENKGFALFPRKVNGLYAMISRQDGENIFLMFSDHPHFWYEKRLLMRPTFPWEFVQLGNCGSPIETPDGWLLLTHGVGAMRQYAIGAALLDLHDPSRVIGRLPHPILTPDGAEREGYVPNVVYSCGALVHAGRLILPYAMSDHASSFATYPLDELLAELRKHPPG